VRVDLLAGTEATHVLAVPNIVHCRKFTDQPGTPMDMSSAMIVVMAVMMLGMMGALAWGFGGAIRRRLRRKREPERSTPQR
jgi:hypothetical protein